MNRTNKKDYPGSFKAAVALEALRTDQDIHHLAKRFAISEEEVELWKRQLIEHAAAIWSDVPTAHDIPQAIFEPGELARTIAENSTQGIAVMDAKGYCIYANRAWQEMTGYSAEELGSQPLHDLVHHHYPDGRPYPMAECPIDRALPENFDVRAHEDLFFRKDGSTFLVSCAASPIFKAGRPVATVIEIRDITERKKIEAERQHFVSLAERSTEFISLADLDLQPFFVNQAGIDLVGIGTLEEALKTPVLEFFFPEDRPYLVNEFFPKVMEEEKGEIEIRFRHFKNSQAIWMIYSVYVLYNEYGKKIGLAAVCRNITERRKVEETLREAARRKDELLAMLAHELRNPLAPIGAAADLLQIANLEPSRIKQTSEVIARQVRHMASLVDDLMDVSRVTRGLVKLDHKVLDVKRIITEAIEQVRPTIEAKRHHLTLELTPEPVQIWGDSKRMVQILVNLLDNAAKYTPNGGSLHVGAEVNDNSMHIAVSDNGIGIEPGLQPHIFELFSQGARNPDRSQGGLGIGLALVKSLVKLHDGEVVFESDGVGKGSTFTIILPRYNNRTSMDNLSDSSDRELKAVSKLRILVVDDNADAADMLAVYLNTIGYEVLVEHGSLAALERARIERPDVYILDIGLPEMDGYALARRLRQQTETADPLLIAVTGYGQEQDKQQASEAGFNHHFTKPINIAALLDILGTREPISK